LRPWPLASTSFGSSSSKSRSSADVAAPEERIVVERHLGVERHQIPVLGLDERVDLQQQAVLVAEQPVDPASAGA